MLRCTYTRVKGFTYLYLSNEVVYVEVGNSAEVYVQLNNGVYIHLRICCTDTAEKQEFALLNEDVCVSFPVV